MSKTALYRHYDARDCLLYVGISSGLTRRNGQHQAGSGWFGSVDRTEVQWFATRADALEAERIAIANERPAHNIANAARKIGAHERQGAFRDALLVHMARRGTAVADLCSGSGVSRDVLMKLRARPGSSTTVENAIRIAAFYGLTVEEFIKQSRPVEENAA